MLFSISSGIPGYCISFPFSLLFVAEDRPVAHAFAISSCPSLAHFLAFSLPPALQLCFFLSYRTRRLRRQEQRQRRWQLPAIVLISVALS